MVLGIYAPHIFHVQKINGCASVTALHHEPGQHLPNLQNVDCGPSFEKNSKLVLV